MTLNEVICEGDVFTSYGQSYTASGNYLCITFPNANSNGCDSTVFLELTVLNPQSGILPPAEIDCGSNSTIT